MNALHYLFSYQLAYLFQSGVPEWSAAQEYHLNSFCTKNGIIYVSTRNNNTGEENDPSRNSNYWRPYAQIGIGLFDKKPDNTTIGALYYATDLSRWITYNGTRWTIVEGAPGDIKYVAASSIEDACDRNPDWEQYTLATGRVLVGVVPDKSNESPDGAEFVDVPLQKHRHLLFRNGDIGDHEDVGTSDSSNSAVATRADYNGRRDYSLSAFGTSNENNPNAYPDVGYSGYAGDGKKIRVMQPTLYVWCLIKL
jgi:hypothetical protein